MELTNVQRLQIIVEWIKRGGKDYMDKDEFIAKVCALKGIDYGKIDN